MSALPCGRLGGSVVGERLVWKNRRPVGLAAGRCASSGMPLGDVVRRVRADQLVEEAARLARVARDFGHAFLVASSSSSDDHRQVDVVLLEAEQAASGRASARWCRARRASGLRPARRRVPRFLLVPRAAGAAATGVSAVGCFVLGARATAGCGAAAGSACGSGRGNGCTGCNSAAVCFVCGGWSRRHARGRLARRTRHGRGRRTGTGPQSGRGIGSMGHRRGDVRAAVIGRLGGFPFACLFLRGGARRRGGFGLVFVRRQKIAELAGGSRQRHGFPRIYRVTYRAPPVAFCRCQCMRTQFAPGGAHSV